MIPRIERLDAYRLWVDKKYQLTLQDLKNKLINTSYQRGPNHNYAYYLSLITQMERNELSWKFTHYRRYMAAYKIQQYWKNINI